MVECMLSYAYGMAAFKCVKNLDNDASRYAAVFTLSQMTTDGLFREHCYENPSTITLALGMFCRESWHLRDHVPLLRRLRWGALPFANLRFLNGPDDRLPWRCGKHFYDSVFERFTSAPYDCDWVGNIIRPGDLQPRIQSQVTALTKDEWYDSMEMFTVGPGHE